MGQRSSSRTGTPAFDLGLQQRQFPNPEKVSKCVAQDGTLPGEKRLDARTVTTAKPITSSGEAHHNRAAA
jgi:hypothetical protein